MQSLIIGFGVFLIVVSTTFDLLVNQIFFFSKTQLLGIFAGILIIFFGLIWKTKSLRKMSQPIDNFLLKEIRFPIKQSVKGNFFDVLVHVLFLIVAIAFFMGRWNGETPVTDLGGDAGNVSTFAAVLDHPENFSNDFIYSTKSNFSFYVSIFIPLIRFLENFVHDYGLAYLLMSIPIIFIHMSGFYFLGKKLFANRFWALFLSFLSLVIVFTESADYWGIYRDPQPRMLCGALFPWLLNLTLTAIKKPKLRVLTIFLAGLMFYIHPVSTPCIGFIIWLGFLGFKPKSQSTGRHLLNQLLLGLLFAATAIPFAYMYLSSRDVTAVRMTASTATAVAQTSTMGMYRLSEVFQNFTTIMLSSFLLPLSLVCTLITWFYFKQKEIVKVFLVWIAGVFFISFAITLMEAPIDKLANISPVLVQLNRSLRYVVPLLEIMIVLPFALASQSIEVKTRIAVIYSVLLYCLGIGVFAVLCNRFYYVTKDVLDVKFYAQRAMTCWIKGDLFCPQNHALDSREELINYIKENTDEESTFFSIPPLDFARLIRYQGLRSVVYKYGDISVRSYSSAEEIKYKKAIRASWKLCDAMEDQQEATNCFLNFAEDLNTDYVIVETKSIENIDLSGQIVFGADNFSVIQLNP
jgi:hypothetical protein